MDDLEMFRSKPHTHTHTYCTLGLEFKPQLLLVDIIRGTTHGMGEMV